MKISRRKFLLNTGVAGVVSTLALNGQNFYGQSFKNDVPFQIPPESTMDALNYLSREHFEAFLHTDFQFVPQEGRAFQLRLVEVFKFENQENQKRGILSDCFALRFESSPKYKVTQGTFLVSHTALGNFSLMISPIGLSKNRFEAVINRLINSAAR